MTDTADNKLDARKAAEERVAPVLDWPRELQALLFMVMLNAGWTRGTAAMELRRRGWDLG